ncbi:hypothetical protein IQ07DRAFT_639598 [Pyrenochaeta sp. DS3sAY3a]|nr:hypothetical protein IQ07DRAFT_639598 [Pyrenochaeta sp. DS3sAY3a]
MPPQQPPSPPDPQRLPFDLASYLLWGPEMRKQHHHLLSQMLSLQDAHSTYETRILATEAVAAAASAATEAIRGMQDKIEAMEAEDKERPFETWAAEQITRTSVFVEENRGLRGRVGDLERGMERSLEEAKGAQGMAGVLKEVERRLGVLEGRMRRDEGLIGGLERKVKRLEMRGMDAVGRVEQVPVAGEGVRGSGVSRWKAAREGEEDSEGTTETEGEEEREQGEGDEEEEGKGEGEVSFAQNVVVIQVPRSPISTDNHEAAPTSIPPERQHASSARHRLMKRPSIHNSKVARTQETHQKLSGPEPPKSLQVALKVGIPQSQLLEQMNPREPKQPENGAPVPRVTRSQAKVQDETPRQSEDLMKEGSSPTKATKSTDQKQEKQKKPIPESAVGKKRDLQPSQLTSNEASKRRKLNTTAQASVIPEAAPSQRLCYDEWINKLQRTEKQDCSEGFTTSKPSKAYSTSATNSKEASPTKPTSPAVTSSSRRFMPDITDYDTYMKMKAENRIP